MKGSVSWSSEVAGFSRSSALRRSSDRASENALEQARRVRIERNKRRS